MTGSFTFGNTIPISTEIALPAQIYFLYNPVIMYFQNLLKYKLTLLSFKKKLALNYSVLKS